MPTTASSLALLRRLPGLFGLLLAGAAMAQGVAPVPSYEAVLSRWVSDALARESADSGAVKFEFQLGAFDSRLKLAPCGQVEAFLPIGARLWGHNRVGLRCIDGNARWSITVPVTVHANGPAWVVRNGVAMGTVLKAGDLVEAPVDWAQESAPVIRDPAEWVGQIAARNLQTGQTLRQGMVRPAQVFQAGAAVRVVAEGPGFVVTSEAQALSAGVVGQTARVRMESGRVTSGLVLDTRTVKIEL